MTSPPQIIVIEDDAATLTFLTMLLEISGYEVQGALNGTLGRQYALSQSAQVILLDRRLPDIDGLVLCEELHGVLGAATPIIMMTADTEDGLLAASLAVGAIELLRKPFMPDTLLDTLSSALAS